MSDDLFELSPVGARYAQILGKTEKSRAIGAKRVGTMWGRYGKGPDGMTCGDCKQLAHHGGYLKCLKFGTSAGPGTDWRAKWPACGAFVDISGLWK